MLNFVSGDIRSFNTSTTFDVVLSLFHVLSYQNENADLLATFKTANRHLRKGGIFIFDCWYGPAVLNECPEVRVKRISDKSIEVLRIAELEIITNRNIVDVNYTISIKSLEDNSSHQFSEKHSIRYLFLPELQYMLSQTGFEIIAEEEWLTKKPLSLKSWSATFVVRKLLKS